MFFDRRRDSHLDTPSSTPLLFLAACLYWLGEGWDGVRYRPKRTATIIFTLVGIWYFGYFAWAFFFSALLLIGIVLLRMFLRWVASTELGATILDDLGMQVPRSG